MTPEERAWSLASGAVADWFAIEPDADNWQDLHPRLVKLVADAIREERRAAVLEEREACARECDAEAREVAEGAVSGGRADPSERDRASSMVCGAHICAQRIRGRAAP